MNTAAHCGNIGVQIPGPGVHARQPPLTLTIEQEDDRRDYRGSGSPFALIRYGPAHHQSRSDPHQLSVGLPVLSPPAMREIWRVNQPTVRGWQDGVGFTQAGEFMFAHLLVEDPPSADLAEIACTAYAQILALTRSHGCPHPLRMWNFLSRIHEPSAGIERYQAFCVGRDRAFRLAGIAPSQFPAATAVGSAANGLLIYLFAGGTPGIPVENPRQVSAYRYPACYGPRPPTFARALHHCQPGSGHFFISGTASVVGHRSLHPGELGPQLRETLTNLEALLNQAQAGQPTFLKVFLPKPAHLTEAMAGIRRWAPADTPVLYLQAEVCRAELEIEIEAVCCPAPEVSA
jgi:chorismate lyase / 3-hydroxybenzoate synthase